VFFDRLDEPIIRFAADVAQGDVEPVVPALGQTWDTRVLVPPQAWGNGYDLPAGKAKLIGHMRNRVCLPRLMRFAQRDPNATGQLVMAAVMHSGQSMSAHPGGMQLESLFGDGPNLHGYLAGRPRGNSDPTGLFMAGDLVASAAMVGVRGLRGGLEGMTEQYAANLEDDLDWAMDCPPRQRLQPPEQHLGRPVVHGRHVRRPDRRPQRCRVGHDVGCVAGWGRAGWADHRSCRRRGPEVGTGFCSIYWTTRRQAASEENLWTSPSRPSESGR
jgi:hypothetical protein